MDNETARMFIRSIIDVLYKYGMGAVRNDNLHVRFVEDGSREGKMFYDHKIIIFFQARSRDVFKHLRPSAPTIVETRPRFKDEPLTAALPAAQHLEAAFAEAAEAMNNFKKALTEAKNVLDSLTNEAEK